MPVMTIHDEKFCKMYGIDKKSNLQESLYRFGYQPKNIDLIINTHLHLDHTGGNTSFNERGGIVPTFPKARYFIQKGEIGVQPVPTERTAARYRRAGMLPSFSRRYLCLVDD